MLRARVGLSSMTRAVGFVFFSATADSCDMGVPWLVAVRVWRRFNPC